MDKNLKVLLLNLPSPPGRIVWRDTAGGFGTSIVCSQRDGKGGETPLHPFMPYASALLMAQGYEFKVIDCQREKLNDAEVLALVRKESPDMVFSIISLPSMKNDIKILDAIKEVVQNVTIVGVGTVCRVIPNEILLKSKVDVVLRNSYPYITNMISLILALRRSTKPKTVQGVSYLEDGKTVSTHESPELGFSDLPNPCYDSIPLDGYESYQDNSGKRLPYILVLESRGCPYNCSYCPYPFGYGREWTYRSPVALVNEIEYLHAVRKIKVFAFKGQTFAYSRKHATDVCKELARRKLDVLWFCESRVDEVDRKLLETMRESGCQRIHYGVETGDPEIIKIAKPGLKLETTKKAFGLTKEYGLTTQAHLIIGWPDDNYQTLKNTKKFLMDINPDVINLNFLTPYPGTKLYDLAVKNSLLLTNDWSNYTSHNVVMRTKSLTVDQLYSARNEIVRDFSRHKLKELIQHFDAKNVSRPRPFFNKAKALATRAIFSTLD